jgi:ribosomal protein S18 acetylase RimI-like enzyme
VNTSEVRFGRSEPDPGSVRRLLEALPDWFGDRESLEEYVRDAAGMPTYLARAGGAVVGAVLLRRHFPESSEIHLIAVDPGWHRRGVGRALIALVEAELAANGPHLLQVKTIGPSSPDAAYARTRLFYRGVGFLPLEELPDLWPPWPFLILVKPIGFPTEI